MKYFDKSILYLNCKCTLESIIWHCLDYWCQCGKYSIYTFCGFKCIQVNITIKTIKCFVIPSFLRLLYSNFASKLNENGILATLWKAIFGPLREILEIKVFTCSFEFECLHCIHYIWYRRKSYDIMTCLYIASTSS